jgi:MoaA/NifB/PqqE/SkfB family radical SAM enzyme
MMQAEIFQKLTTEFPFAHVRYRNWQSHPLQALFQVTHNCPARCEYCNSWGTNEPTLSLAEVESILDKFRRMGVLQLAIYGGEPLLRKDLPLIVQKAVERGMVVTTITSGLVLNEQLFTALMRNGLSALAFSLDGVCAQTHEGFRRGTSFAKVIEAITLAICIRNKHGFSTQINTSTVVHRKSLPELTEISHLTQSLGVNHARYQPVWPTRDDLDFVQMFGFDEADRDEIRTTQQTLLQLPHANLPDYIQLFPSFYLNYDKVRRDVECYAGRAYIFVDFKGDLYPCNAWNKPFGSLLREEPEQLLEGEKAKQIFVEAAQQRACGGCSLTCHQEPNIILNKLVRRQRLTESSAEPFVARVKPIPARELPMVNLNTQSDGRGHATPSS